MLATEEQHRLLVQFFKTGKKLEFSRNEFIVHPGEDMRGVYYIESGIVKTYDITKYGEENLLIVRKSGEILGLTLAITSIDRHVINAAMSDATLWYVTTDKLYAFLRSTPEAALPIVDTATEMYRLHSERIMTLEYRTVRERLASFLMTMSDRFGRQIADGILVDITLRHQDIASSISATRETASRTLAELERKGILTSEQSKITILNPQKLRSYIQ